jgi:hypothetical protein
MRAKSTPNPFYEPAFRPECQNANLTEAYCYYRKRRSDPRWLAENYYLPSSYRAPFISPDVVFIRHLWWDGIVTNRWRVTLGEFTNFFKFGCLHGRYTEYPRHSGWWGRGGECPYRNGNSYRRNTAHEKKEENPKAAWREASGKARERQKPHFSYGPRAYYKRKAAKEHRRWVRQELHHERYDSFHDREYTWFADPWDWD